MTCCAWACLALTEGSPVAVPAATKAAVTTRMSTGACRFRTLITDSRESLAAGAPEGPVRHKFGRLPGVSDTCNFAKRTKVPQFRSDLPKPGRSRSAQSSEILGFPMLRSRGFERLYDQIRG